MSVYITRTEPVGNGQVQVWGRRLGGTQEAHVIVGNDLLSNGMAYILLERACANLDQKSANLNRQSILDSETE